MPRESGPDRRHGRHLGALVLLLAPLLPSLPSAGAADEAALRARLGRAREAALKAQDERVLGPLIAASRRLANDWGAIPDAEKERLAARAEAALGIGPPAAPLPPIPFAVPRRESLDVPYTRQDGADPAHHRLDLYAPREGSGHPVLIWSHGGGFVGGDKAHPLLSAMKPDFFVARGFVFVSLNYRLAPREKFPAQAYDTAAALAFLHDHVAEYGGDPGRMVLVGDSAGGQLAAVVATNATYLAHHGKTPAILRGAVVLDIGSFDVPAIRDRLGAAAPKQYRDTFDADREDWIAASPLLHVAPEKAIPPLLLVHVAGRAHHEQENRRFAAKLRECGYRAEVVAAKDRTHHTLAYFLGLSDDPTTTRVMQFLADVTGPR